MKKYISILLASILCLGSCDKMVRQELTQLHEEIDGLKERLENFCNEMNTNIAALQTIVDGLVNNDYVESVEPIKGANDLPIGYIIKFHKSGPVTIYHGRNGKDGYDGEDGEDGSDGEDGEDGTDGADGTVPVIGVRQDVDGNWYWTLDGEWLLDDKGNKVRASGNDGKDGEDGEDGKDGEDGMDGSVGGDGIDGEDGQDGKPGKDGKDGVTPQLRINGGYWYISYDKGVTWTRLGKATGEDGAPGKDADVPDAIFTDITFDDNAIYFTLKDGSVITVNKNRPLKIHFEEMKNIVVAPGTTVSINYTIEGGDSNTQVECIADNGWKAKVVAKDTQSGAISVTAPEVEVDGKVLVFVTAGDGRVHMSCLTFVEGRPMVGQPVFTIGYEGGDLSVYVTTRIEYTVKIVGKPAWVALAPATKAVERTDTLRFTVEANPYSVDREAEVQLHDLDGNLAESFIIRQKKNTTDNGGIVFVDPEVERICLENWDTDGNGSLSYAEAAAVTSLGKAFSGNDKIKSFDELQYFTGLKRLWMKDGNNISGDFSSCYNLISIYVPDGVEELNHTFSSCTSLLRIHLPESIKIIDDYSFSNCNSLSLAELPQYLEYIGYNAFFNCSKITIKFIPDTVHTIEERAFYSCDGIIELSLPNVVNVGREVFENCTHLRSVIFEPGWLETGASMFENCNDLYEVILPEGLLVIKGNTFLNCKAIESISFPSSLMIIGSGAFSGCERLDNLTFPKSIESIESSAFSSCISLKSIDFTNVKSIGSSAFRQCTSLESIELPETINIIGDSAFSGCTRLSSVKLSENLSAIGASCFNGCKWLTSIDIPESVTSIGYSAFSQCISLESVKLPEKLLTLSSYCFSGCESLKLIRIPDTISSLSMSVFEDCTSLYNVELPSKLIEIQRWAFRGCTSLTTIDFPNSLEEISDSAFEDCSSLKEIVLPKFLTVLNYDAFKNCSGLETIIINSIGLSRWASSGYTVFSGCSSLKTLICHTVKPATLYGDNFSYFDPSFEIRVPSESVEAYKAAKYWSDYASHIFPLETE